ncbi:MAG: hypothetical protein AAGG48_16535 [Planctomycetota bacterium]
MTSRFHGRKPLYAVPLAAIALLIFARPGISTSGPIDDANGSPGAYDSRRETQPYKQTREVSENPVAQAAYLVDERDPSGALQRQTFIQRASVFDDPIDPAPFAGRLQLVTHAETLRLTERPAGQRRSIVREAPIIQDASVAGGVVQWSESIRSLGDSGLEPTETVGSRLVEVPTIDFVPIAERPWTATQSLPSPVREDNSNRSVLLDSGLAEGVDEFRPIAEEPNEPDYSQSLFRRFWSRFRVRTDANDNGADELGESGSDAYASSTRRTSLFPFVLGVPSQATPSLDDGLLDASLLDANWYQAERRDTVRFDTASVVVGVPSDELIDDGMIGSNSIPLAKVTEAPVEQPYSDSLLKRATRSRASHDPTSELHDEVNQLAMNWMPGATPDKPEQPEMTDSLLQRILRRRQTDPSDASEAIASNESTPVFETVSPEEVSIGIGVPANTVPVESVVPFESVVVEAPPANRDHSDSILRRIFGRGAARTADASGAGDTELPPIPTIVANPDVSDAIASNAPAASKAGPSDGFSDSLIRRALGERRAAARRHEANSVPSQSPDSVLLAENRSDQDPTADGTSEIASTEKTSIFDIVRASMEQPVESKPVTADGYSDSLVQRVLRRNNREEPASESVDGAMDDTVSSKPSRIASDDPYSDSLIKRIAGSRKPKAKPEWNSWAVENPNRYSDSLIKRVLPERASAPPTAPLSTPTDQIAQQVGPTNQPELQGDSIAAVLPSSEPDSEIELPAIPETMDATVASMRQTSEPEDAEELPKSILADDSDETSEPSSILAEEMNAEDSLDLAPPLFDDLVQESIVINQMPVMNHYPSWHPKSWFKWKRCRGLNDCACEIPRGGIGRERVMHAPFEVDTTQPMNQYRFGLDLAYNHQSPNRAEYLWASPLLGPTAQETSADYQDFRFMFELGTEWLSVATEIPIRGMNPAVNPNHAGLGDMNITTKTRLLNGDKWQLTQILRTHLNTGSPAMGLGTGHVSMEPGFLARYKINDSNYLHGSIKYWVPIGGTPVFAGEVLNTGIAWSYLQIDRDDIAVIHVAEFVNWIVAQGQETIPGVGDTSVDGDTIYNLYLGTRLVHDAGGDLGLVEYGVNWGTSLSQTRWYENLVRFEARFSY